MIRKIQIFALCMCLCAKGKAAMQFASASSQYVDVGNSSILNPTAGMSIVAWVRFDTFGASARWFIGRDDGTSRSYSLGYEVIGGNYLELQINGGATIRLQGATMTAGVRYHIAATGDPANGWKTYINGTQQGSAAWVAPNATSINTNIGRRPYTLFPGYVEGLIDDVRIYNRGLSVQEIQSLFSSNERLPITEGLVGYWRFDDGNDGETIGGTGTVRDLSGNGNHGTPTNGPVSRATQGIFYP